MTPEQLIAIVDEVHGILRLKGDGRIHLELPASWAQIGGRAEPTTPTSFGSDLRYASVQGDAHPFAHAHRELLRRVRGLELIEIDRPDECCGFGGSFCVTDEAVSAKMGYNRVNDFHRRGVEYIVSADMSCLLHMKGVIDRLKLPIKVIHVAQILNGGPA